MAKIKNALPCPFCGSIDLLQCGSPYEAHGHYISCGQCNTIGPNSKVSSIEALKLWNTRSQGKEASHA